MKTLKSKLVFYFRKICLLKQTKIKLFTQHKVLPQTGINQLVNPSTDLYPRSVNFLYNNSSETITVLDGCTCRHSFDHNSTKLLRIARKRKK